MSLMGKDCAVALLGWPSVQAFIAFGKPGTNNIQRCYEFKAWNPKECGTTFKAKIDGPGTEGEELHKCEESGLFV